MQTKVDLSLNLDSQKIARIMREIQEHYNTDVVVNNVTAKEKEMFYKNPYIKAEAIPFHLPYNRYGVKRIIKNGPATIVFWADSTKTVVMHSENDPDDIYYAFCAALAKKVFGNNSKIKKILSKAEYTKTEKQE